MPTGQRKFAREDGRYADFLDTNSGNLQPDGTAFIGSSNLAAPSDHIHPGGRTAAYAQAGAMLDFGYLGATVSYLGATAPNNPTASTWAAGYLFLVRIDCLPGVTANGYVTVPWTHVTGLANTYIALYNSAGTQLGVTGDLSATAAGVARVACTGFTATPANGIIYALYVNGTSGVAAGPQYTTSLWSSSPLSPGTNTPPGFTQPYPVSAQGPGYSAAPASLTLSSGWSAHSAFPIILID